jgi:hypothetical protein
VAPWAAAIAESYSSLVGKDSLGALTLTLLSTSKEPVTYRNYNSHFARFVEYCEQESPPLNPLQAHVGHVCRFVTWQGLRGTVSGRFA